MPRTGSVYGSRGWALSDERFLRADYAELVSLRRARTVQDSAPVWPMPARRVPSARRRSISWSRSAEPLLPDCSFGHLLANAP
jgi:hypothetical protein